MELRYTIEYMEQTPKQVFLRVQIPADLRRRLKAVAALAGKTMNQVTEVAVREYCEREGKRGG